MVGRHPGEPGLDAADGCEANMQNQRNEATVIGITLTLKMSYGNSTTKKQSQANPPSFLRSSVSTPLTECNRVADLEFCL